MKRYDLRPMAGMMVLLVGAEVWGAVHYVSVTSTNPLPPYLDWATAAVTIQDGVDAAGTGDEVLVNDGIYRTGGHLAVDATTNRVAVMNRVLVRSLNGPAVTIIEGYQSPAVTNGPDAMRCVYLADGAALSGFTLTNGGTQASSSAGGLCCASTNSFITNCVLIGNAGGGSRYGTLENCTLAGNTGGGASASTLNRCVVTRNSGGGTKWGILNNCVVSFNFNIYSGAGVSYGSHNNCTIVSNTSSSYGAGAYYANRLNNCIVYYNHGSYADDLYNSGAFNCCVGVASYIGANGFTNAPLFVDLAGGDFHLQPDSPCINAGQNAYVVGASDLGGNARIAGGTVDVGAFEFPSPTSLISYQWLQEFHLPTDGSADYQDTDGDGMNNWQEWRCGTDPLNSLSVLKLISVSPTPYLTANVSWFSIPGRSYRVELSTNLLGQPAFIIARTNIVAPGLTTTVSVRGPTGACFYRVAVAD